MIEVGWQHYFGSICQEERGEPHGPVWGHSYTLEDRWDLCNLSLDILFESVKDVWLESLEDHAIGPLDLTISTRVSNRGPIDPDAISIIEVQEPLPGEVCSVVGDDTVRDTKPIDDVEEEFDRLFQADIGDGLRLYPLGKLVYCYEQVSEATQGLFEGSDHVEALDCEWLGDRMV